MGPMTGRAGGYCAGNPMPGYMHPGGGRGFWGRGGGGGRGWGWRNWFRATGLTAWQRGAAAPLDAYAPPMSAKQQLDSLKGQAEYCEDALKGIRQRIAEIEAQGQKD